MKKRTIMIIAIIINDIFSILIGILIGYKFYEHKIENQKFDISQDKELWAVQEKRMEESQNK